MMVEIRMKFGDMKNGYAHKYVCTISNQVTLTFEPLKDLRSRPYDIAIKDLASKILMVNWRLMSELGKTDTEQKRIINGLYETQSFKIDYDYEIIGGE